MDDDSLKMMEVQPPATPQGIWDTDSSASKSNTRRSQRTGAAGSAGSARSAAAAPD